MTKPTVYTNELYTLLHSEKVEEFNLRRANGEIVGEGQLSDADFRGLDLRNLNADGLDFSGSYFRGADLRGIDFRNCNIEGISFCQAHISGCYFPEALSAEEIRLSFDLGTRVRYRK